MWKKIKPWHIIVAILVITAIILIYVNRTWIADKLGINKGRIANNARRGTLNSIRSKNPAINKIINDTQAEMSRSTLTADQKFSILNARLAQYGMMILPDGQTPNQGGKNPTTLKMIKCGCCDSTFFGLLQKNCYWCSNALCECGGCSGSSQ